MKGLVSECVAVQVLHDVDLGIHVFWHVIVGHKPKGRPESVNAVELCLDLEFGEGHEGLFALAPDATCHESGCV